MPRELVWKDGKLFQKPLKEMEQLRKNSFSCELSEFSDWMPKDCCFEMCIDIEDSENIKLQLREDVTVSWDGSLFTLELGESGHGRRKRVAQLSSLSDFTVFSDTSSIEIFINGGETVMTSRVYSKDLEQTVKVLSENTNGHITGYELGALVVEEGES